MAVANFWVGVEWLTQQLSAWSCPVFPYPDQKLLVGTCLEFKAFFLFDKNDP